MERDSLRPEKILTGKILSRSFYNRPTEVVSRDLLGKILVHGNTAGIIVETEAYPGRDDLASHSAVGITDRTRVIFGPPGHAYVYLAYGMHQCMNIVAKPEGEAGGVLIRALEPVAGIEMMRIRRPAAHSDRDLTSGPGKLTQALAITRQQNGVDMTRGDLVVRMPQHPQAPKIDVSKRIGITKCADLPLRFTIAGNPFVSK